MDERNLKSILGCVPLRRSDYDEVRDAIDGLHAVFSQKTVEPMKFVDAFNDVLRVMQFDAEFAVRTDFAKNFKGTPFFGSDGSLATIFLCAAVKPLYESKRANCVKKRDLEYLVNNIVFDRAVLHRSLRQAVYDNVGLY